MVCTLNWRNSSTSLNSVDGALGWYSHHVNINIHEMRGPNHMKVNGLHLASLIG